MGSSPISGTAFCFPRLPLFARAPYRELQRSSPFEFLLLQPLDPLSVSYLCPVRRGRVDFVSPLGVRRGSSLTSSLSHDAFSPVLPLLWGGPDESRPGPGNLPASCASVALQREAASPVLHRISLHVDSARAFCNVFVKLTRGKVAVLRLPFGSPLCFGVLPPQAATAPSRISGEEKT